MLGAALSAGCSAAPTGTVPRGGPAEGYRGPSGLVAYIADTYDQSQGFIEPVCLANGKVGPRIPVGGQPFAIAISPGGRWAYVANSGWDGPRPQSTVTPVDLANDRAGPAIQAGVGPMGIAITPDGARAYVADMGSFLTNQTSAMVDAYTVTPIDLSDDQAQRPIVVGPGVGAISITPDGKRAIVAIDGTSTHPQSYVEVLDLATEHLSAPIEVGAAPMAIAVTPDGRQALVTDTGFRPLGHTVTPIDLTNDRAGRPIPVGNAPIDIVVTPDGKEAFVADTETVAGQTFEKQGTVSTIDVATDRAGQPITVPDVPQAVAITPDGKTVYEVGFDGEGHSFLAPIDVATHRVGPGIAFPFDAGAVAIARAPTGFC